MVAACRGESGVARTQPNVFFERWACFLVNLKSFFVVASIEPKKRYQRTRVLFSAA